MSVPRYALASRAMLAVLSAQFLSALADNALLFAAIALLQMQLAPDWQIPLLQAFFVAAFILLAPFVGPFADSYPKGRVMLIANSIKLLGATLMLFGFDPLLSYGLVGLGAAAYSPAKYGILTELVSPAKIVKANGLMEGSTIVAILLGAVLGGKLAAASPTAALIVICSCYVMAAWINTRIPKLVAFQPKARFSAYALLQNFSQALKSLWTNADARLSLLGSSIFWGAGSTLRLLLVAWVPVALNNPDLSLPASLSGAVAIGIAIGAAFAASLVSLKNVNRVLPAGISIGLLIMLLAQSTSLLMTIALLVCIGIAGGFYVVPLNALLQERGHETVGSGNAVAVQNFFENSAMLALVGIYILMQKNGVPVVMATTLFGGLIFVAISLLAYARLKRRKLPRE